MDVLGRSLENREPRRLGGFGRFTLSDSDPDGSGKGKPDAAEAEAGGLAVTEAGVAAAKSMEVVVVAEAGDGLRKELNRATVRARLRARLVEGRNESPVVDGVGELEIVAMIVIQTSDLETARSTVQLVAVRAQSRQV